jgi:hypothetical protein
MQYKIYRSVSNKQLNVIFIDGTFDRLPDHVRKLGPWQSFRSGLFENLLPLYQEALSDVGFVIVEQPPGIFLAEF